MKVSRPDWFTAQGASVARVPPTVLIALTLLAATLPLAGCDSNAETSLVLAAVRPVFSAEVEPSAHRSRSYTGVVTARTESDLGFRVGGKIVERHVDPGDRVQQGATLFALDVEDFELALRAARDGVRAAEAEFAQARNDERRYAGLAKAGAASRQSYEIASTRLEVAEAELAAARAEANQVDNRRGYSTLIADRDGVITDVLADRGQVVAEGQVIVRLAHDGPREAQIDLPETQRAFAGNPAAATLFGESQSTVSATLRELSAAADPITRTFRARYVLDGETERFPLGATVTLRLTDAKSAGYTRVPIGALYDAGRGSGVWLIDRSGSVSFVPVTVAKLGQEFAEIEDGIEPGQQVVALGSHLLHEGDVIRTVALPAAALALTPDPSGR